MTLKDKRLLTEAYRRYNMFHVGESLIDAWLGLGSPSQYQKSIYFKPKGEIQPRCDNWWKLTYRGREKMKELLVLNTWHINLNNDLFSGDISLLKFPSN